MRKLAALLFTIALFCASAWASPGACPSGANYLNPANPNGPLVTLTSLGVTGCYYFDIAGGADSNTGTSENSPQAHLPGMADYTGSLVPTAATGFILKGGDTWPNASFPITWASSGASGSPIYIGVDKAWYAGSSWTRPVFNAGGSLIATHNNFVRMSGGGGGYTTWDNIEFTGYTWSGSAAYGEATFICAGACSGNSVTNVTITNNYFHHWNHGAATSDGLYILLGNTNSPYMSGSVISSNVFDNSDGDTESGAALYGWSGTITDNILKNTTNGILIIGGGEVGANNIGPINSSFDPSVHENCIESLGGSSPTWYIHDNICHDGAVGEASMLGNNGETDYVWNNLIYNWQGNSYHFAQNSSQNITAMYFWNNTVVPASGASCFVEVFSPIINNLVIQNNHCITTGPLTSTLTGIGTQNITYNVLETPTNATNQGYTASETYAFSPTLSTGATVGVGTTVCGGLLTCSGPLIAAQSDTSYACTEQSVSGVIVPVCPARVSVERLSSIDAGAYQYSNNNTPLPPTGVVAVAN